MTIIPSVPLLRLPRGVFCVSSNTFCLLTAKQPSLYRLVLKHGYFGIHNMAIRLDAKAQPLEASLYDWEAGDLLPAILSYPTMSLCFDLVEDKNGALSVIREVGDAGPEERAEHMRCARVYFKALYEQVPNYNVQYRQGKTHAAFGLPYKTGEVSIRKNISAAWELGLRQG